MKSNYLIRMLLATALLLSAFTLHAQRNKYGIALQESFEDGIPKEWYQYYLDTEHPWEATNEVGMGAPSAADKAYWAALKNPGNMKLGYITQLATPIMNLDTLVNPVLIFSYMQTDWMKDVDTLYIRWRNNAPDANWTRIRTYATSTNTWRNETISFPNAAKNFQIAFEGVDNLGGGIAIDNVYIMSDPKCDAPTQFIASAVSNDSAVVSWNPGAAIAENWQIRVSSRQLTAEELAQESVTGISEVVIDEKIGGYPVREYPVRGLTSGTTYYMYVRGFCMGGGVSDWSRAFSFTTSDKLIPDPRYVADFNMKYTIGQNSQDGKYFYGSSKDLPEVPFINTGMSTFYLKDYSLDNSTALIFSKNQLQWYSSQMAKSCALPAGSYAYMALPELASEYSVKNVQVSFVAGKYNTRGDVSKITVGVMTDADEYTSFEAVRTVEVTTEVSMKQFIVNMSDYEGNGRYIAFMSDFKEASNAIFIDDVVVEVIPSVTKANDLKIGYPSATEITVEWEDHGATGHEVVFSAEKLTEDELKGTITVDGKKILDNVSGATLPLKVTRNVAPWQSGYMYARNIKGLEKGEWSIASTILTPGKMTQALPDTFNFVGGYKPADVYYPFSPVNKNDYTMDCGMLVISTEERRISNVEKSKPYLWGNGGARLEMLQADRGDKTWVIFPATEGLKGKMLSMWATGEIVSGAADDSTNFIVGVMSDANDATTFIPVDTIETKCNQWYNDHGIISDDDKWMRYFVYFDDAKEMPADAKFFAFYVTNDRNYGKTNENINYVDEVILRDAGCRIPSADEFKFEDVSPTEVKVSWANSTADKWNVKVWHGDTYVSYANLVAGQGSFIQESDVAVTASSFTVKGLKPNGEIYWFAVQPVDGGKEGDWTYPMTFTTSCLSEFPVPYIENFDMYFPGNRPVFAAPCITAGMSKDENNKDYPYISMNGYNSSPGSLMMGYNTYVAFPQLTAENLSDLSIWMYIRTAKTNTVLEVGVMENPDDISTFEKVKDVFVNEGEKWCEAIVDFSSYKKSGKHVALRTPASEAFLIDSVVIDKSSECPKVSAPTVNSVTAHTAEVSWTNGLDETAWEILLAGKHIDDEEVRDAAMTGVAPEGISVLPIKDVKSNPFTIENLAADSTYFFYVRANCGGAYGEWANDSGVFRTQCDPDPFGTVWGFENSRGEKPYCWTAGNLSDTATTAPAIVQNAKTGEYGLVFNNAADEPGLYAVSPTVELPDGKDIRNCEVQFWGLAQEGMELQVGVRYSTTDRDSWWMAETVKGLGVWTCYTVSFEEYLGTASGKIGSYIEFRSSGLDYTNSFVIDDITVKLLSDCPAPNALEAKDVKGETASLSWARGTAPYTIWVSAGMLDDEALAGEKPESVLEFTEDKDMNTELVGLEPNTKYYAYVRSACPSGSASQQSGWSVPVIFSTVCAETQEVPYAPDFSLYDGGTIPPCWTSFYTEGGDAAVENAYPQIYSGFDTWYGNKDLVGKSLFVFGRAMYGTSYAVMPLMDKELKGLTLAFDAKGSYYYDDTYIDYGFVDGGGEQPRSIIVGVCDDASSMDQVVATFDTVMSTVKVENETSGVERYFVTFDEDVKGKYIVFTTDPDLNMAVGQPWDGGYMILNVEVYETPSCQKPERLEITGVTDTTISVKFSEIGSATEWKIKYVEKGKTDTAYVGCEAVEYTLTGLTQSTTYDLWISSQCSDADSSVYSGPLTATTLSTPLTVDKLPYSYGFDDEDENKLWFLRSGSEKAGWSIGVAGYNSEDTGNTSGLYVSPDGGKTMGYNKDNASYSWAYRIVDLPVGTYEISYDWRCFGEKSKDYIRAGLIPDSYNPVGGSNKLNGEVVNADSTLSFWMSIEGFDLTTGAPVMQLSGNGGWQTQTSEIFISDEMAGRYKLVFFWSNDGSGGDKPAEGPAIDLVRIDRRNCVPPAAIKVAALYDNSIALSWDDITGKAENWKVWYMAGTPEQLESIMCPPADKGKVVIADNNTGFVLSDGINATTTYRIFVKAVCDEIDGSESGWSAPIDVTTPCARLSLDQEDKLFFGFEQSGEVVGWEAVGSTTSYLPSCFAIGSEPEKFESFASYQNPYPYIRENTDDIPYAHTGKAAIQIKGNTDRESGYDYGKYLVFPLMDCDLSDMQVRFWMRPSNWTKLNNGQFDQAAYARSVSVGTMTDPSDPETYQEIKLVQYPLDIKFSSQDPNAYWQQFIVNLEGAKGDYLVFKDVFDTDKFSRNLIYLDDVTIEPAADCFTPTDLTVDVSDSTIRVSFKPVPESIGSAWEIRATYDEAGLEEAVAPQKVTESENALVTGFMPDTKYYIFVRTVCADDGNGNITVGEWSKNPVECLTDCGVRYHLEFSDRERPSNWIFSRANTWDRVVVKKDETVTESVEGAGGAGWTWTDREDFGLRTPHYTVEADSICNAWMQTPVIDLREYKAGDSIQLTFDLALTQINSGEPILDQQKMAEDKAFVVLISTDEGKKGSYSYDNSTVWGNGTALGIGMSHHSLAEVSHTGEKCRVNLSKYAGMSIKIAFFAQSDDAAGDAHYRLHLDNVQVNTYINRLIEQTLCEGEPLSTEDGFFLSDTVFIAGEENNLYLFEPSSVETPDTNYTVKATVKPLGRGEMSVEVCEGYEKEVEGITVTRGGIWMKKMTGMAANGCDSVLTVRASVIPTVRSEFKDTVCGDAEYVWKWENGTDTTITDGGTYTHTFPAVTGCDSVVTLHLFEVASMNVNIGDTVVCFGGSVTIGVEVITEPGEHTVRMETASGCDSVVTLNLIIRPELKSQVDTALCKGETYMDDGAFRQGVTTNVFQEYKLKSVDGCDSLVTYHIYFIDNGFSENVSIEIDKGDLPYRFFDKVYDENTVGTVTDEIKVTTKCADGSTSEGTINLTLTVLGTDVSHATVVGSLILAPNPVEAGGSVEVRMDADDVEMEGLTVRVFTNTGSMLQSFSPDSEPVIITGLNVSGVYVVRVTDGRGHVYQGKIIVK